MSSQHFCSLHRHDAEKKSEKFGVRSPGAFNRDFPLLSEMVEIVENYKTVRKTNNLESRG